MSSHYTKINHINFHIFTYGKNLFDLFYVVFGQDIAIQALAAAIKMARSGLGNPNKPIGSFLFSGPTGVGKTETAKQLAEQMTLELIRFDMSEYQERHSVAKFIGAPPGYVGYEDGNMGSGLLINELEKLIESKRLNADEIRRAANDWDFSEEGRKRQSKRMSAAALKLKNEGNNVIADFICPTPEARKLFPADYIVWVDTIQKGRFEDTNQMFVKPEKFDFHVTSQNAKKWSEKILTDLSKNV